VTWSRGLHDLRSHRAGIARDVTIVSRDEIRAALKDD